MASDTRHRMGGTESNEGTRGTKQTQSCSHCCLRRPLRSAHTGGGEGLYSGTGCGLQQWRPGGGRERRAHHTQRRGEVGGPLGLNVHTTQATNLPGNGARREDGVACHKTEGACALGYGRDGEKSLKDRGRRVWVGTRKEDGLTMGWLIDGHEETRGANRYGGERVNSVCCGVCSSDLTV